MLKKAAISILCMLIGVNTLNAHNFESSHIPSTVHTKDGKSELALSQKYFKDGTQSLLWSWKSDNATLSFTDTAIRDIVSSFDQRSGVKLWIFNETPQPDPIVFQFRDAENVIQYTFNFNLNFTGWRAAWIAYSDMWTPGGEKTSARHVVSMDIVSPGNIPEGKLWFDRIEFTDYVDRQATPDAQIPQNNRHLNREIWHWGLLHKWEQQKHDMEVSQEISTKESTDLALVYDNVKQMLKKGSLSDTEKKEQQQLIQLFSISENGKKGAPLMQNDNTKPGDVNFGQLNKLLDLSARGWYADKDNAAKENFLLTIRYMLNQGFAWESGMGTNHHYGYQIRDIFGAVWWMEDVLRANNLWEETRKAVTYWSGLQETRQPFNNLRDELTDSWNTLLIPRLACALWADTENERLRDMKALSRWVNGSLRFSPGTIGGIKVDGTAFHHGGHYPAYSVPGLSYVGKYLKCVNRTQFTLNQDAFAVMKFALLSLSRQTNLRDWGMGVSGRHPFNGSILKNGILTYAYAAMVPVETDKELAGEYLRLMEGMKRYSEDNALIQQFKKDGISLNAYPKGFYVYNYASQGIYRYNKKMVAMKGFTQNIWGSEIYVRDNRFGRYQSYGSVQIIGTPTPEALNKEYPVTEEASRYKEAGWDWNRNPGTTTIHLPLELLNSPFPGSDMLRQPESFAGASLLNKGEFGMFAMKLGERDRKNFTPSFHAHKSVFAFGNRIVALGSAIRNDNREYPTETTLFQQHMLSNSEPLEINEVKAITFPYRTEIDKTDNKHVVLKNLTGEYYYLPQGQSLIIEKKRQESKENKRMNPTHGNFATAYIHHGVAPQNETYEYMILLDATKSQIKKLKKGITEYEVIRKDEIVHIVHDRLSDARGYAIFEDFASTEDDYLEKSDKEIMIMMQPMGDKLKMSVCDPDLHLGEYIYTTPTESNPITREITLKGKFVLSDAPASVSLLHSVNNTVISVICCDGIPVEFTLSMIK
jgi:chondroitin-sulfate-ABC endolyase/exolyase